MSRSELNINANIFRNSLLFGCLVHKNGFVARPYIKCSKKTVESLQTLAAFANGIAKTSKHLHRRVCNTRTHVGNYLHLPCDEEDA